MKTVFLYEHPSWSNSLIEAFQKRGIELELLNIADANFDTSSPPQFKTAINRINIMPSFERSPRLAIHSQHYLNWLDVMGVQVINGAIAHRIGGSKVLQNAVFSKLKLDHPKAIAIYHSDAVVDAADKIGFPVIVKPNIGGSGIGVALYQNREDLVSAVKQRSIDLGVDGTGIVQEYVNSDGYIYRVEMLGDRLFYAIKQRIQDGSFNYCAADGCSAETDTVSNIRSNDDIEQAEDQGIEVFAPVDDVISNISSILIECGADLGGVEYFIRETTNEPCYYDFNPYSNFVANGEQLLGFSPEKKYIDFVLERLNLR
jgi:hypothetical protein